MAQGFDAASPQRGINFKNAPGQQFVIIKAGGGNVGQYVAPAYVEQIDGARAAGLHLGHYWLTGKAGTPTEQADFLVNHLHQFDIDHHLLALDNEVFLDESGSESWGDAKVAEFWAQIFTRLPQFPHHHALTYGGAAYLRGGSGWPKTNALGVRWWVAAYGTDDGQDHGLAAIDGITPAIHQYTSAGKVDGRTVDLDISALTVEELFGAAVQDATKAAQDQAAAQAKTRTEAAKAIPKTSASITGGTGKPGSYFWKRLQLLARKGGYAGVIDGRMGVNSWKGVQRYLTAHHGYRGAIDGLPGRLTYAALQRLATRWGYTGPIDGAPGRSTWRAVAKFLNLLPGTP